MKKFFLTWLSVISISVFSQIPPGYYNQAGGLNGEALQQALHNIIKNHNDLGYGDLWEAFEDTDKKSNGKVWDIYSDVPGGTPPYQFNFGSDQCGNYSGEGDCFNREHSFPRSWFGGTVPPMNSDLFHIYPTDGYVNGQRSNLPFGEVNNANWTSLNGSKRGNNAYPGYSGEVFEPIDEYKGDVARSYFYMATRYYNEDGNWPGSPMVDGAQPLPWALNLLFDWHENDPVSQKEINRNNAIYSYQYNRNPFIDHPEFVENIWFFTTISTDPSGFSPISIFPNPSGGIIYLENTADAAAELDYFTVSDLSGRVVIRQVLNGTESRSVDLTTVEAGIYFLAFFDTSGNLTYIEKIIKN